MFPHSYTFNPGMVLDPVTMTPMLSGGGNITVNPLGVPMRPENKVWQKMFINNIPQECTNQLILKLLNQYGTIKNFKRAVDNRGRLMNFCHFQLQTAEQILRIKRLFNNVRLLDKILQIKISAQTQNFIKEWITIQKDQWRKKLIAPGMNQAKQYDTIEQYFQRDDRQLKKKIDQTLRIVNNEVKNIAREKMRQQQRKQHPRQKQRDRKKRRIMQQLQRSFNQKQDYWLKRQRQREREYKKQKQREKEKQRAKLRRLQKQMNMDPEQQQRRCETYLTSQRRKQVEKQELEDIQIILLENPPLPQQLPEDKKKVNYTTQQMKITCQNKVQGDVLVQMPQMTQSKQHKERQLKKNQIFNDWDQLDKVQEQKPQVQLHLPQIQNDDQLKFQEQRIRQKIEQLQKLVPKNKQDLWQFPIDWDRLSKSVILQRNIRPWLIERSDQYMGGVQQKFIALVEKKLLSRSHPDKIIKVLKGLLDDDSQQFVIRLWKVLALEYLKLQNGLV